VTVPDLVHLDEGGVADALLDRLTDDRRVRHEDVVAYDLDATPEGLGEGDPPGTIRLTEAILDRPDG
jgi:hypothetical protein